MTPENLAALRARMGLPATPSPPAEPPPEEVEPEPPPEEEPAPVEDAGPLAQLRAEMADYQRERSAKVDERHAWSEEVKRQAADVPRVEQQPLRTSGLSVGDVADLDAAQAPSPTTAALIRRMQAGPFQFEPGTQEAKDLRLTPLERATGEMGLPPTVMEKTLSDLYLMKYAQRSGQPYLNKMSPEDYQRLEAKAKDEARRFMARDLGADEGRQNALMPADPQKAVDDIMSGDAMPWPLKYTPAWIAATNAPFGLDETFKTLARPFIAESSPGFTAVDVEGGQKVLGTAKEHPLWWFLRTTSVSTPVFSWALDPTMTWELGGENGYGSRRHVEKIVGGYDAAQDFHSPTLAWADTVADPLGLGRAVARAAGTEVTPGASTLVLGTMLFEPDLFSLATLGAGKTIGLVADARKYLLTTTAGALDTAAEIAEAKGAAGAVADAGEGSHTATAIKETSAEVQLRATQRAQAAAREAARLEAELTPRPRKVDPDAAAEAATTPAASVQPVNSKAKAPLDAAQERLAEASKRVADEQAKLDAAREAAKGAKTVDPESFDALQMAAVAAVNQLDEAQAALVTSSAVKDLEPIASGATVIDMGSGQSYRFVGYRASTDADVVAQARDLGDYMGSVREARAEVGEAKKALDEVRTAGRERVSAAKAAGREVLDAVSAERSAAQKVLRDLEQEHAENVSAAATARREATVTQLRGWQIQDLMPQVAEAEERARASGVRLAAARKKVDKLAQEMEAGAVAAQAAAPGAVKAEARALALSDDLRRAEAAHVADMKAYTEAEAAASKAKGKAKKAADAAAHDALVKVRTSGEEVNKLRRQVKLAGTRSQKVVEGATGAVAGSRKEAAMRLASRLRAIEVKAAVAASDAAESTKLSSELDTAAAGAEGLGRSKRKANVADMVATESDRRLYAAQQAAGDDFLAGVAEGERVGDEIIATSEAVKGDLSEAKAMYEAAKAKAAAEARASKEFVVRTKAGPTLAVVVDEAGNELAFPLSQISRAAKNSDKGDVQAVFRAVQASKMGHDKLIAAIDEARKAGDLPRVRELAAQLKLLRAKHIQNLTDMSVRLADEQYKEAAKKVNALLEKVRQHAARGADEAHEVAKLEERLQKAMSIEAARKIEVEAIANLNKEIAEGLRRRAKVFREAAQKGAGEMKTREMGRSALDEVMERSGQQFVVNGDDYEQALIRKYGADALDEALDAPGMDRLRTLVRPAGHVISATKRTGNRTLSAADVDTLMNLERTVHAAAERLRLAPMEDARRFLSAVGDHGRISLRTQQGWIAAAYQMTQWAGRLVDGISASKLGTMAEPIRQVGRRSYERFARWERDLGAAAKSSDDPIEGLERLLTTHEQIGEGVTSNQGAMLPVDKLLAYLRVISGGTGDASRAMDETGKLGETVWNGDIVVTALTRATMGRGNRSPETVHIVNQRLHGLVSDPTTTGQQLWTFLKDDAKKIMGSQTSGSDVPERVVSFLARAVAHGSNQYDALQDLGRIVGPHLNEDAVDALNWFAFKEKSALERLAKAEPEAVERAYRVMQAYGLSGRADMRGAVKHLFGASEATARLLRVGEMEGKGVYIPQNVVQALNEVPNRLAKEMREFNDSSLVTGGIDAIIRNWRIVAVNGWLLPRASIYLTNFLGDWAQMTTTIGLGAATRISAQSALGYIPFVGPRLEKVIDKSGSMLPALFDRRLNVILRGSPEETENVLEGVVSHRRLMNEGIEDGAWGNISSGDMNEALGMGAQGTRGITKPTRLVEGSARFLEEAQSRARMRLYVDARTGKLTGKPMSREAARQAMVDALYDWRTGVPQWEHNFLITRLAAFWNFRRGMMRQTMNAVMEGFAEPGMEATKKALTGQTKLSRMRKLGRAVVSAPDAVDWQDPEEPLDDYAQLDAYARKEAPWWIDAQTWLGNSKLSPERALWYSEVAGSKATYEALILPTLTTLDQLTLLNLFVQTSMASSVMAAEAAGLKPRMTSVEAGELAERNIAAFTEMLIPYANEAVSGAARQLLELPDPYRGPGIYVPRAQAVVLRRILDASGQGQFMAAAPSADGRFYVDRTVAGHVMNLLMHVPQVNAVARDWAVFDNPGMNESLVAGLTEALGQWTGAAKSYGFDPMDKRNHEVDAQEMKFKGERSLLRKELGLGR